MHDLQGLNAGVQPIVWHPSRSTVARLLEHCRLTCCIGWHLSHWHSGWHSVRLVSASASSSSWRSSSDQPKWKRAWNQSKILFYKFVRFLDTVQIYSLMAKIVPGTWTFHSLFHYWLAVPIWYQCIDWFSINLIMLRFPEYTSLLTASFNLDLDFTPWWRGKKQMKIIR